jgi:hypothetical protein
MVAVLCFVGDISFSNRYLDRLERLRRWLAEAVRKRDCRWSPSHTEGDRQSPGPQGLIPSKPMGFLARLKPCADERKTFESLWQAEAPEWLRVEGNQVSSNVPW